jgi:hypothetical protein
MQKSSSFLIYPHSVTEVGEEKGFSQRIFTFLVLRFTLQP